MEFQGKGFPLNDEGMDKICDTLSVSDAEVWAVITVETRGFGFLADRRPRILFERHKFHMYTTGAHSHEHPDISSPDAGGYIGGAHEYDRLAKAMGLDRDAALMSASWGIGQVMGFNFEITGYPSVEDMVAAMIDDENVQLMAMANFIKANRLDKALQRRNWASFARGYNGPKYKTNEYDTRLAAAHAKYSTILPDITLRSAQAALLYLGINPGPVDGLRGRRTRSALTMFQERNGIAVTGDPDKDTLEKLLSWAF